MAVHGPDEPVYTIGVMARLLRVSTQVLRSWEREALVRPFRTCTNNRLYSENDYYRLQRIRALTQQGINMAGIRVIVGTAAHQETPVASESQASEEIPGAPTPDDSCNEARGR